MSAGTDLTAQHRLFARVEAVTLAKGLGEVLDAWGDFTLMRSYDPHPGGCGRCSPGPTRSGVPRPLRSSRRPGRHAARPARRRHLPDRGVRHPELGFTYPVTARGKDGSAYVLVRAHRDAAAVRDGRLYRFDTATHTWSRVAVVASGTNYSFYPDDLQVDAAGRVHVLWEGGPWPATTHRHLGSYAVFSSGR